MVPFSGFPEPLGRFVVGREQMDFSCVKEDGKVCALTAFFFYPSDDSEGKTTARYSFPEYRSMRDELLKRIGSAPEKPFDEDFSTCCYEDIGLSGAAETYPVLLYNHGAGNFPQQGTMICQELASEGYLVVSVGHPGSGVQKCKDGRVIPVSEEFLEGLAAYGAEVVQLYMQTPQMLMAKLPDDEAYEISRKVTGAPEAVRFSRFALAQFEDVKCVADALEKINSGEIESIFTGRLDLKAGLGIFGHSFGGTVSAIACRDDARFVCGVNYDGNMLGALDSDLKKPFLQLCTPLAYNTNAFLLRSNSGENDCVIIDNIHHYEFCDSLFTNRDEGFIGSRDPMEIRKLITSYTKAFFDRHLLKQKRTALETLSFPGTELIKTGV